MSADGVAGMQVPPHPHIGLQTVTWLIEGNVLHRDGLGSEQMIQPGQLKPDYGRSWHIAQRAVTCRA